MPDSYSFAEDARTALNLVAAGIMPVAVRCGCDVSQTDRTDAHAMIKHLLDAHKRSFDSPSAARFSPGMKPLAHEVRLLRNRLAHGATFDWEEELRLLSSCWRLLLEMDATESEPARTLLESWRIARVGSSDTRLTPTSDAPGIHPADANSIDENQAVAPGDLSATDLSPWFQAVDERPDESDPEDGTGDRYAEPEADDTAVGSVPHAEYVGYLSVEEVITRLYDRSIRTYGKMREPLWVYQGESTVGCPRCGTLLDVCRLGAHSGQPDYRSWAVVCVACGTAKRKQEYPPEIRSALWRWGQLFPASIHWPPELPIGENSEDDQDEEPTVSCLACGQRHWAEPGVQGRCAVCDAPLPRLASETDL